MMIGNLLLYQVDVGSLVEVTGGREGRVVSWSPDEVRIEVGNFDDDEDVITHGRLMRFDPDTGHQIDGDVRVIDII